MSLPLLSTLPTPSQNRSNGGKDQVNSLPHTDSITKGATVWKIGFKKRYLTRSVAQREGTDSQELKLLPPSPHRSIPAPPNPLPSSLRTQHLSHPPNPRYFSCPPLSDAFLFLPHVYTPVSFRLLPYRARNKWWMQNERARERERERGGRKGERGSRGDNEESQKMFSCVLKEIGTSCLRF